MKNGCKYVSMWSVFVDEGENNISDLENNWRPGIKMLIVFGNAEETLS